MHPRQVPVVVAAFTPDPAEVARARQTLAELAGQAAAEVGVRALPDGRMVDRAMAGRARTTLAVQAAVDRYLARSA